MSSPFLVPDGWQITKWDPDPADEALSDGVPTDGVQTDGPLSITFDLILGSGSFSLHWLSQNGEQCFVSELQPAPESLIPMLIGTQLTVSFGPREVPCDLKVFLTQTTDSKKLSCRIDMSKPPDKPGVHNAPDTGGGTFTATANGG
jgi:hypothetical protein